MAKYIKLTSSNDEQHFNLSSKDEVYDFIDLLKSADFGETFELERVDSMEEEEEEG